MYKVILMMLLAIMSSSAMAKWTAVNENKESIQYVDLATIRKSGNKVKMWGLRDYKSEQEVAGDKFLSSKIQWEYECKEEQLRQLFFRPFSGYGGRGQPTTWHNKPGEWKPVMPQSIGEIIWKIACGKTRATAEWTKVDIPSLSDVATQYVDLTTITKAGNKAKMWKMLDIESAKAGDPRSSMVTQDEFDCKEMMRRALSMTLFHGNMGTGGFTNISGNKKPRKWYSVEPDSTQEVFWKFACGK